MNLYNAGMFGGGDGSSESERGFLSNLPGGDILSNLGEGGTGGSWIHLIEYVSLNIIIC